MKKEVINLGSSIFAYNATTRRIAKLIRNYGAFIIYYQSTRLNLKGYERIPKTSFYPTTCIRAAILHTIIRFDKEPFCTVLLAFIYQTLQENRSYIIMQNWICSLKLYSAKYIFKLIETEFFKSKINNILKLGKCCLFEYLET